MSYSDKPLMDIPPRNQIAVWWKVKGKDLYGQSSYESPVEINCRWDDVMEEFIDVGGNRQMSKAKVFRAVALEAVSPSGSNGLCKALIV